jgi:hypothetical protein
MKKCAQNDGRADDHHVHLNQARTQPTITNSPLLVGRGGVQMLQSGWAIFSLVRLDRTGT